MRTRGRREAACALALAALVLSEGGAAAQTVTGHTPRPDHPSATTARLPPPDPPVAPAPAAASSESGVVDGGAQSGDPLQANGFGGALCRNERLKTGLGARAQGNCRESGSVAARAPLSHYGFDVHIDTGFAGISSRTFQAAVQDLVLTPLWGLLLWVVHAVLAALEWSYALDLLDHATLGSVADALRSAQRTVTDPWLAAVLAIAAIGALFHGLVRRRIAEAFGGTLAMLAMMLVGLWVIANPVGTVGELNRLVNDASLGTLGAVTSGRPDRASDSYADGLAVVFESAIAGPWCYLEFGDVDWCRNPRRLDPDLVRAGRRLRTRKLKDDDCGEIRELSPGLCVTGRPASSKSREREARLLAQADTNGELFLALPANSAARNAINDPDSLYRALCASDDDSDCRGRGAEAAQWRTESGTWPRTGGLFLIAIGIVGMVALLVFIAARLLGAAVLGVVYLLLAPVAVLAPALGENGRAAFRGWGMRLIGALVAKLVYSVLLGVVLVVLGLLAGMGSLGWWTQWLLIAAFWWVVFARRNEVLHYAALGHHDTGAASLRLATGMLAARQAGRLATGTGRQVAHARAHAASRHQATRSRIAAEREHAERATLADDARLAGTRRAHQATRLLEAEHRDALAAIGRDPDACLRALGERRRLLARNVAAANQSGDRRTALRAQARLDRTGAQLASEQARLERARERAAQAAAARHATGSTHSPRQRAEREALLDHQAALRRGVPQGPRANRDEYRDYPRLAALAGVERHDYLARGPGEQRRVRLTVDRELARRVADRGTVSAAREAGIADRAAGDFGAGERGRERGTIPRARPTALERQFAVARRAQPTTDGRVTASVPSARE